jgi:hypothetical protein
VFVLAPEDVLCVRSSVSFRITGGWFGLSTIGSLAGFLFCVVVLGPLAHFLFSIPEASCAARSAPWVSVCTSSSPDWELYACKILLRVVFFLCSGAEPASDPAVLSGGRPRP